jgi:hypothetical protein
METSKNLAPGLSCWLEFNAMHDANTNANTNAYAYANTHPYSLHDLL